jgi:uncharacterized protein (TIGR02391 family)
VFRSTLQWSSRHARRHSSLSPGVACRICNDDVSYPDIPVRGRTWEGTVDPSLARGLGSDEPVVGVKMIFFTTFVTIIRRSQEAAEERRGSPAQVAGNSIRLPIGTDVQQGDYLEHRLPNDELRMMTVIDVIHPYMPSATNGDDHIEVTCVPSKRAAIPRVIAPALHPTISVAVALAKEGRMSDAVFEALRLVEERVRSLTVNDGSGRAPMEEVFGTRPPQLDITTTTGNAVHDESEGFRLLFIGAMLALRNPHYAGRAAPVSLDETMEYLAVASMLMRRLDLAGRGTGRRWPRSCGLGHPMHVDPGKPPEADPQSGRPY